MISRETSGSCDLASSRSEIIRTIRVSSFRSRVMRHFSLVDVNLVLHALVSLIQLALITQPATLELWTISYLFSNVLVISAVILVNYFPYQVLIDDSDTGGGENTDNSDLTRGFLIARRPDRVSSSRRPATQPARLILKEPTAHRDSFTDDANMIDSAFFEHKQRLKTQALSNKSLSFGVDQPSMHSAYRAALGFALFSLASLFFILSIRLLHSRSLVLTLILASVLLLIALGAVHVYLLKNHRETIYRKNLFYKTILFPYVQLALVFIGLFALVTCFAPLSIGLFLLELLVLVSGLALVNRLVYARRRAAATRMFPQPSKTETWESAMGEPLEMNVFTIDTYKSANRNSFQAANNNDDSSVFEIKVDAQLNQPSPNDIDDYDAESVAGLAQSAANRKSHSSSPDQESNMKSASSLKKIGSETSNINLLI